MKKYVITFILVQITVIYTFAYKGSNNFAEHKTYSNFKNEKVSQIFRKSISDIKMGPYSFDYTGGISVSDLPDCDEECTWEVIIENNGECEWLRYVIRKGNNNNNKLILICDATNNAGTQTKQVIVRKNGVQVETFEVTRYGKIIFESLIYDIQGNGGADPAINVEATAIGGGNPYSPSFTFHWIINDEPLYGNHSSEISLTGYIQTDVRILCIVEDDLGQTASKMITFGVN